MPVNEIRAVTWALGLRESRSGCRRVLPTGGTEAACDVLITHGPPLGRGDRPGVSYDGTSDAASEAERRATAWGDVTRERVGCEALLREVQTRVRPLLHLFGHVHADWGCDSSDGTTVFVNASVTDAHNSLRAGARVKTVCLPVADLHAHRRRLAAAGEGAAGEGAEGSQ
mmetsp:Transcript_15659/g.37005  ORF Transcript_15659/g.37005 Transcript_15659/m.37005 type:complete len:170 (-) Transcript_15659:47-556(-)